MAVKLLAALITLPQCAILFGAAWCFSSCGKMVHVRHTYWEDVATRDHSVSRVLRSPPGMSLALGRGVVPKMRNSPYMFGGLRQVIPVVSRATSSRNHTRTGSDRVPVIIGQGSSPTSQTHESCSPLRGAGLNQSSKTKSGLLRGMLFTTWLRLGRPA